MKRKIISIVALSMALLLAFPMPVSAADGIFHPSEFDALEEGDGKHMQDRGNYHLDIDLSTANILEKESLRMINVIANFFFGTFKEFSYITLVIFYHSFTFDISEMFRDELFGIQDSLRNIFFNGGIFLIVFSTSAFFIIKQLLRGNIQGLLGEILKVLAILVISMSVATESASFLHFVNTTTKEIAVDALGGISGQALSSNNDNASLKKYAASAAGMMWSGLVHQPWVYLEFGDDYGGDVEARTQSLLALKPDSDDREELAKQLNRSDNLFDAYMGTFRIIMAYTIMIPVLIKDIFILIISLLLIAFQVFMLLYVILCPLILLLAVSPQLGGTELIWSWLKKIIETQLSVLILTFVIGLIMKYDNMLSLGNSLGWIIGLWLQVFVIVALVLNWQKVLMTLGSVTSMIQNPQMALSMRTMRRQGMNMSMPYALPAAAHGMQQLGGMVGAAGMEITGGIAGDSTGTSAAKANYGNVKQYSTKAAAAPAKISDSPPAEAPVPAPQNINESTVPENATVNASGFDNQSKVINYNDIQGYKGNKQKAEPAERPASYEPVNTEAAQQSQPAQQPISSIGGVAVNNSELFTRNKPAQEAAQKPQPAQKPTSSSGAAAANNSELYTRQKSTQEAVQKPTATSYSAKTTSYTPPNTTTTEATRGTQSSRKPISEHGAAAENGRSIPGADKTTAEATQKPSATNYNNKTQSYVPANTTLSEQSTQRPTSSSNGAVANGQSTPNTNSTATKAAQKPAAAEHATKTKKGTAPGQVPNATTAKAQGDNTDNKQQQLSGKNASVISNARQYTPKPVVKDFDFNPQRADNNKQPDITQHKTVAKEPENKAATKHKPAVEQFNFKVHEKG